MGFGEIWYGAKSAAAFVRVALNELSGAAQEARDAEERRARRLEKFSLTCRKCNQLAQPIEGTGNRYACACGQRFAAARHGL